MGALTEILAAPAARGIELRRLLVRAQAEDTLWAAEQALRSGSCGAVLAWPAAGGGRPGLGSAVPFPPRRRLPSPRRSAPAPRGGR